ncbi:MAG: hypothetical protein ACRDV1_00805 [Actinomycetes bacterium]
MTSTVLFRLTALAGIASAVVLVFNFLRRAEVVPDVAATQALAPLSATFGLVAVTGLFLWHRREGRVGTAGTAGYATNLFGLTGIVGIEYIANVIFPRLDDAVVDKLVAGPPGTVFLVISVVFLLGVLAFTGVLLRGGLVPRAAAALYGAGFAAIALRTLLPEAVVAAGGFAAAAGLAVISLTLYRRVNTTRLVPSVSVGRSDGTVGVGSSR